MVSWLNYIHIKCPNSEVKLKAHSRQSEKGVQLTPRALHRPCLQPSAVTCKGRPQPSRASSHAEPEQVFLAPTQVSLGLEARPCSGKCSCRVRIRSDPAPFPLPLCGHTVCCGQEVVAGHAGAGDTQNWTHMITSTLPFP